jgi:hypothetical protein
MTPCHEQQQKRWQSSPNTSMHPKSASRLAALLLWQANTAAILQVWQHMPLGNPTV